MSRRKLAFAGLLLAASVAVIAIAFTFGDPGSSGESSGIAGLAAVVAAVLAVYLGGTSNDEDRNG